jgi:hypothetical protein
MIAGNFSSQALGLDTRIAFHRGLSPAGLTSWKIRRATDRSRFQSVTLIWKGRDSQ